MPWPLAQVQVARDAGALVQLRFALTFLGLYHIARGRAGHSGAADRRRPPDRGGDREPAALRYTAMMLAAWRGQEHRPLS